MAQRAIGRTGQPRHSCGKFFERTRSAEQRVEYRIRKQLECEREAAAVAPARALRRGHRADLRRAQYQAPRVE